jgi:tRNA wybutosine-synthesizing protein 2
VKYKKIGKILVLDKNFEVNKEDTEYLKSLQETHNVDTIIKIKSISGQMREPSIEVLLGCETETIHKENGCYFKLDLSKVMWAKGNNNERLRIAKLVKKGEVVSDMFAGIGYFTIPIGVHSNAKQVNAIEINPNSYNFLVENIKLNKINEKAGYNRINPVLGDCAEEVVKFKSDRIIMGYVKTTHHYLKPAIESLKNNGIIHYHETVPEKLINTRPVERIKEIAGERDVEVLNLTKIKKYSPGVWHIVVDAKIS